MSNGDSQNDLGGLQIPPSGSANAGDHPDAANLSASAEHVRSRKQRSDAGKPRGPRSEKSGAGVSQLSQVQFAQLYSPDLWARVLTTPADAMASITGKKHWEVSQNEKQAVGVTGSIAAQCFAVSDPRWLALALCAITVLDVYGVRIALELADRRREAAEKRKAQANGGQPGRA